MTEITSALVNGGIGILGAGIGAVFTNWLIKSRDEKKDYSLTISLLSQFLEDLEIGYQILSNDIEAISKNDIPTLRGLPDTVYKDYKLPGECVRTIYLLENGKYKALPTHISRCFRIITFVSSQRKVEVAKANINKLDDTTKDLLLKEFNAHRGGYDLTINMIKNVIEKMTYKNSGHDKQST